MMRFSVCLLLVGCLWSVQAAEPLGWTSGIATFTGSEDQSAKTVANGACGYGELSSELYPGFNLAGVALDSSVFKGKALKGCGTCVEIKCTDEVCDPTKVLTVMLYDNCDKCGPEQVNLQAQPFKQLAPLDIGRIGIQFREVPCRFNGGMVVGVDRFRTTMGGWVRLVFKNVNGPPLAKVEFSKAGVNAWRGMSNNYGAAWEASRLPELPWDVKLTNIDGQSIVLNDAVTAANVGDVLSSNNFLPPSAPEQPKEQPKPQPQPQNPAPEVPKEQPKAPETPKQPEQPKAPETPKQPEQPKTPEVPKQPEQPKAPETPKEQPKTPEVPKEQPKAPETPKPVAEQPKAEQPKAEQPKAEQPKAEQPKAEQPKPVAEPVPAEKKEEAKPVAEQPKGEQPKPAAEQPKALETPKAVAEPVPAAKKEEAKPVAAQPQPQEQKPAAQPAPQKEAETKPAADAVVKTAAAEPKQEQAKPAAKPAVVPEQKPVAAAEPKPAGKPVAAEPKPLEKPADKPATVPEPKPAAAAEPKAKVDLLQMLVKKDRS